MPLNFSDEEDVELERALCRVRVTGIEDAGRPTVVSRTWHVIGGFLSGDAMVEAVVGGPDEVFS